jgi:hypothetical protein
MFIALPWQSESCLSRIKMFSGCGMVMFGDEASEDKLLEVNFAGP